MKKEKDLTRALQLALHSRILRPLKNHLKPYPSLPVFTTPNLPKPVNQLEQLPIPTFSLSPSETISRVADGLLNLPRLFEIYHAEEDALGWEVEGLPFLREEREKEEEKERLNKRASRLGMLEAPSPSLSTSQSQSIPEGDGETSEQHALGSHLMSLTISMIHHLLTNVLPSLPSTLPQQGAQQLAADLGYLENVVRALDLEVESLGVLGEEYEMWRKEVESLGVLGEEYEMWRKEAEAGRRWRKV
ncbi:hypothetical protein BT69DRAFT_5396 [Atractiella rhizophila]|nr:hypothetical protein BT69DRAFT_5396 [Atractiella rhizophila]